jgi:hypothetical protein
LAPTAWLRDFVHTWLQPFRALRRPDSRKVAPGDVMLSEAKQPVTLSEAKRPDSTPSLSSG